MSLFLIPGGLFLHRRPGLSIEPPLGQQAPSRRRRSCLDDSLFMLFVLASVSTGGGNAPVVSHCRAGVSGSLCPSTTSSPVTAFTGKTNTNLDRAARRQGLERARYFELRQQETVHNASTHTPSQREHQTLLFYPKWNTFFATEGPEQHQAHRAYLWAVLDRKTLNSHALCPVCNNSGFIRIAGKHPSAST